MGQSHEKLDEIWPWSIPKFTRLKHRYKPNDRGAMARIFISQKYCSSREDRYTNILIILTACVPVPKEPFYFEQNYVLNALNKTFV
jgi:hypothetical protein